MSTIRPSATSPSTNCAPPIATRTRGLIKGGADVLMIETVFDTLNCKAAIFAIEEVFDGTGRAPAGLDFRHHHRSVGPHPDRPDAGSLLAFGAPCQALCHRPQLRAGRQGTCAPMSPSWPVPADTLVSAHPNAGLPNEFGGYDETPESMAEMIGEFARSGLVNIVGGCCGTKPEHIKAFGEAIAGVAPRAIPEKPQYMRLSGLEPFTLTPDLNFINVGERTNITGSAKFRKLIAANDYEAALEVARSQVENGAQIIDINMDEGLIDSEAAMTRFVNHDRGRARHLQGAADDRQLQMERDPGRPELRAVKVSPLTPRRAHRNTLIRGGVFGR